MTADRQLACGHIVTYPIAPPATGDRVYCLRCDRETRVIGKVKRAEIQAV